MGFGILGFQCWACFGLQKSIFFTLFLELEFLIDFEAFWEGLGRFWGGFGKGLGRLWGEFGGISGDFGEGNVWGTLI